MPDKLDLAVYETAHNCSMGMAKLADAMGLGKQVLINKVNYNNEQNKLSLRETVHLIQATGDLQILQELAWVFDCELLPLHQHSDKSLLAAIVNVSADHGKVHQTIEEAFFDRKITTRELQTISHEVNEAVDALHTLLATIESYHAGLIPKDIE